MVNFIHDDAEISFGEGKLNEFVDFLGEREATGYWFDDESGSDGTNIKDIRFKPIPDEPICVPSEVAKLKASNLPKFEASEDAYSDSMYSPQCGLNGSTQMMCVKGKLIPVGASAIKGINERAGTRAEGWDKLRENNPEHLSEVMDRFMMASKGQLSIYVQDEKVRAFNTNKYAICPISFVARTTKEWIEQYYPLATFEGAYYSHNYSRWIIDLSSYTTEILGVVQALVDDGYTPAVIIQSGNSGMNSISIRPALKIGHVYFPIGQSIDTPHKAAGTKSSIRSDKVMKAVEKSFDLIFPTLTETAEKIENLKKVNVKNSYNALLRGLKFLGLPKVQSMEAADQFLNIYGDRATAYDIYATIVDVLSYVIRDFPNNDKKIFDAYDAISKALFIDWVKYGNIPGTFSW